MKNHAGAWSAIIPLALSAGPCVLLGGCVAAVLPIAAATGLIGGSTVRHGHPDRAVAATAPTKPEPVPPVVAPVVRPIDTGAVASADPIPVPVARRPVPHVATKPAPLPAKPQPAVSTTTWNDVVRQIAKAGLKTTEPMRANVLHLPGDTAAARCGKTPTAVVINAATLGSADYIYVGALHTMGYEIVLTSAVPVLPGVVTRNLSKQGIAAPVRGKTLFLSPPDLEHVARAAIARQYCVIGLVGNHAGDFPGSALPGTPKARAGWFLIVKPMGKS